MGCVAIKYLSKTFFEAVLGEWVYRENTIKPLLVVNRAPLISPIPKITIWYKVKVDKLDLPSFSTFAKSSVIT
jgi:hypothetical protein